MTPQTFYRFDDLMYDGGYVRLLERTFALDKETPCGYWIKDPDFFGSDLDDRRWVSKTARKRFAYPTRALAIKSFIARKRQQKRYMKIKYRRAEQAYDLGLDKQGEILEEDGGGKN